MIYGLYIGSPTGHSSHCTLLNSLDSITEELSLDIVTLGYCPWSGTRFTHEWGWGNACKCKETFSRSQRRPGTIWTRNRNLLIYIRTTRTYRLVKPQTQKGNVLWQMAPQNPKSMFILRTAHELHQCCRFCSGLDLWLFQKKLVFRGHALNCVQLWDKSWMNIQSTVRSRLRNKRPRKEIHTTIIKIRWYRNHQLEPCVSCQKGRQLLWVPRDD